MCLCVYICVLSIGLSVGGLSALRVHKFVRKSESIVSSYTLIFDRHSPAELSLSATLRLVLNPLLLPQHSPHDVLSLMISRSLLYTTPSALSFLLSIPCSQSPLSSTFISPICRSCVRSLPLSLSLSASSSLPLPARFVHTVTDRQLRKTDDRPTANRQTDNERERQIDIHV